MYGKRKKLTEKEMDAIMEDISLLDKCSDEQKKQVQEYAFGADFLEGDSQGELVEDEDEDKDIINNRI